MAENRFASLINERKELISALSSPNVESSVSQAVDVIVKAFLAGGRLYICGNGGSAADAQHMAAEFVGRFCDDRPGLPAIALTTDTSALTAIANDWSYNYVFKRQLEALVRPYDVVLGISTSGASQSVLDALAYAKTQLCRTVALTGSRGVSMVDHADIVINVGAISTPIIQERMLVVEHVICQLVEEKLRGVMF